MRTKYISRNIDSPKIIADETIVVISRADSELRVSRQSARTTEGRIVSWIDIRGWSRPEDCAALTPDRCGIKISTGSELEAVAKALAMACAPSPQQRPTARPAPRVNEFA